MATEDTRDAFMSKNLKIVNGDKEANIDAEGSAQDPVNGDTVDSTIQMNDEWTRKNYKFDSPTELVENVSIETLYNQDHWNNKNPESPNFGNPQYVYDEETGIITFSDEALFKEDPFGCKFEGSDEVELFDLVKDLELLTQFDRIASFGSIYDFQVRQLTFGSYKYANALICTNLAKSLGYLSVDKIINDEYARKKRADELNEKFADTDQADRFPPYEGLLTDTDYIEDGWVNIDHLIHTALEDEWAYDSDWSFAIRTRKFKDRKRLLVYLMISYASSIWELQSANKLHDFGIRVIDRATKVPLDYTDMQNSLCGMFGSAGVAHFVGELCKPLFENDEELDERVDGEPLPVAECPDDDNPEQFRKKLRSGQPIDDTFCEPIDKCDKVYTDKCSGRHFKFGCRQDLESDSVLSDDEAIDDEAVSHELMPQFRINPIRNWREDKQDILNTIDAIHWTTGIEDLEEYGISQGWNLEWLNDLKEEFGTDAFRATYLNENRGFHYAAGDFEDGMATGGFYYDFSDDTLSDDTWGLRDTTERWTGTAWSIVSNGGAPERGMGLAGGNYQFFVTAYGVQPQWTTTAANLPAYADLSPINYILTGQSNFWKWTPGDTWVLDALDPIIEKHSVAGIIVAKEVVPGNGDGQFSCITFDDEELCGCSDDMGAFADFLEVGFQGEEQNVEFARNAHGFAFNGSTGPVTIDAVSCFDLDTTFIQFGISSGSKTSDGTTETFDQRCSYVDANKKYPIATIGTKYVGTTFAGLATGGKTCVPITDCGPNAKFNKYYRYFDDSLYDENFNSIIRNVYEYNGTTWIRRDDLVEGVAYHTGVGNQDWAIFWGGIHSSLEEPNLYVNVPGCGDWFDLIETFGGAFNRLGICGLDSEIRYADFATFVSENNDAFRFYAVNDSRDDDYNGVNIRDDEVYSAGVETLSGADWRGYVTHIGHFKQIARVDEENDELELTYFFNGETAQSQPIKFSEGFNNDDPLCITGPDQPITGIGSYVNNFEGDWDGETVEYIDQTFQNLLYYTMAPTGITGTGELCDGSTYPNVFQCSLLSMPITGEPIVMGMPTTFTWECSAYKFNEYIEYTRAPRDNYTNNLVSGYDLHSTRGGLWLWTRPSKGENLFHPENFTPLTSAGTFASTACPLSNDICHSFATGFANGSFDCPDLSGYDGDFFTSYGISGCACDDTDVWSFYVGPNKEGLRQGFYGERKDSIFERWVNPYYNQMVNTDATVKWDGVQTNLSDITLGGTFSVGQFTNPDRNILFNNRNPIGEILDESIRKQFFTDSISGGDYNYEAFKTWLNDGGDTLDYPIKAWDPFDQWFNNTSTLSTGPDITGSSIRDRAVMFPWGDLLDGDPDNHATQGDFTWTWGEEGDLYLAEVISAQTISISGQDTLTDALERSVAISGGYYEQEYWQEQIRIRRFNIFGENVFDYTITYDEAQGAPFGAFTSAASGHSLFGTSHIPRTVDETKWNHKKINAWDDDFVDFHPDDLNTQSHDWDRETVSIPEESYNYRREDLCTILNNNYNIGPQDEGVFSVATSGANPVWLWSVPYDIFDEDTVDEDNFFIQSSGIILDISGNPSGAEVVRSVKFDNNAARLSRAVVAEADGIGMIDYGLSTGIGVSGQPFDFPVDHAQIATTLPSYSDLQSSFPWNALSDDGLLGPQGVTDMIDDGGNYWMAFGDKLNINEKDDITGEDFINSYSILRVPADKVAEFQKTVIGHKNYTEAYTTWRDFRLYELGLGFQTSENEVSGEYDLGDFFPNESNNSTYHSAGTLTLGPFNQDVTFRTGPLDRSSGVGIDDDLEVQIGDNPPTYPLGQDNLASTYPANQFLGLLPAGETIKFRVANGGLGFSQANGFIHWRSRSGDVALEDADGNSIRGARNREGFIEALNTLEGTKFYDIYVRLWDYRVNDYTSNAYVQEQVDTTLESDTYELPLALDESRDLEAVQYYDIVSDRDLNCLDCKFCVEAEAISGFVPSDWTQHNHEEWVAPYLESRKAGVFARDGFNVWLSAGQQPRWGAPIWSTVDEGKAWVHYRQSRLGTNESRDHLVLSQLTASFAVEDFVGDTYEPNPVYFNYDEFIYTLSDYDVLDSVQELIAKERWNDEICGETVNAYIPGSTLITCVTGAVLDVDPNLGYTEWGTSFVMEYKKRNELADGTVDKYYFQYDVDNKGSNTLIPCQPVSTEPLVQTDWRRFQDGVGLGGDAPIFNVDGNTEIYDCHSLQRHYVGQQAFGDPHRAIICGGYAIGEAGQLSPSRAWWEFSTVGPTFKWSRFVINPEDTINKNYRNRNLSPFYTNGEQTLSDSLHAEIMFDVAKPLVIERFGTAQFDAANSVAVEFETFPDFAIEKDKYSIALTPSDNVKVWWSDKGDGAFTINVELEQWTGTVDWRIIYVDEVPVENIDGIDEQETYDQFEDL
jgi:hypothetical protein